MSGNTLLIAALVSNQSTTYFFESASPVKQQWAAHFLNAMMIKIKKGSGL